MAQPPTPAPGPTPHPYAEFLHKVAKPARYTGGEVGSKRKDWSAVEARVCLAFPDVYDIGMSHLGYKILYSILNDDPRTLAERTYCPWTDMEAELRARKLPLVSHESARPLRDFDVIGLSLQFELTYTNCLTILDLGGVPLRAADRGDDDPLVLGGGPNATHPEPVSMFFDAFVIGDGEQACTEVALAWARMKREGVARGQRLVELAKIPGVYVPSLYEVKEDPSTGLEVVVGTRHPDAPRRVRRTLVPDLNAFPFPTESPVGGPEAIFDRMSIEIARGCTEGCRFCQAGMIYRPVRERDPEQVVETVLSAVKKAGYDEVSLTSLSTADASCIAPLLKRVADKLAPERVSLSVSSLRAYGLSDDLLDEIRRVRANGLTFAPEAGTQRMRDVVNKNVTEEQLLETAERTFGKGWDRMKLYFMIGLPTETDDDVRGIVETGRKALDHGIKSMKERGRGKSLRKAQVVVSVSTHVPKPHTPFQWCAMDTLADVRRKQGILRDAARRLRIDLKVHDADESVLEGVFARGDRRLGPVIEEAYRRGARFDSWEEHSKLELWQECFDAFGIDIGRYLGTLPVTGRLPWDHIDVGLEDGFLASEYRKALKSRLSPPCGKAVGMFVHHTNVQEAQADKRRLVCYDCGVACDMSQMRQERVTFLKKMGAETPDSLKKKLPLVADAPAEPAAAEGLVPDGTRQTAVPDGTAHAPLPEAAARAELPEGLADAPILEAMAEAEPLAPSAAPEAAAPEAESEAAMPDRDGAVPEGSSSAPAGDQAPQALAPRPAAKPKAPQKPKAPVYRYRFGYRKLGPVAFLGHLDLIRALPRVLRRLEIPMAYTEGFHPKPDMVFGPALSLGVPSLDEYVDVKLTCELDPAELLEKMNAASPEGLSFTGAARLGPTDAAISRVIAQGRYALCFARSALDGGEAALRERVALALAEPSLPVRREVDGHVKTMDVRAYLERAEVGTVEAMAAAREAGLIGDLVVIDVTTRITGGGTVKASEVAEVLAGGSTQCRAVRMALCTEGGESPLAVVGRKPPAKAAPQPPAPEPEAAAGA